MIPYPSDWLAVLQLMHRQCLAAQLEALERLHMDRAFLGDLRFTDAQLLCYERRILGIEERLCRVIARRRKQTRPDRGGGRGAGGVAQAWGGRRRSDPATAAGRRACRSS